MEGNPRPQTNSGPKLSHVGTFPGPGVGHFSNAHSSILPWGRTPLMVLWWCPATLKWSLSSSLQGLFSLAHSCPPTVGYILACVCVCAHMYTLLLHHQSKTTLPWSSIPFSSWFPLNPSLWSAAPQEAKPSLEPPLTLQLIPIEDSGVSNYPGSSQGRGLASSFLPLPNRTLPLQGRG